MIGACDVAGCPCRSVFGVSNVNGKATRYCGFHWGVDIERHGAAITAVLHEQSDLVDLYAVLDSIERRKAVDWVRLCAEAALRYDAPQLSVQVERDDDPWPPHHAAVFDRALGRRRESAWAVSERVRQFVRARAMRR